MNVWLDDERPMPPGYDVHVKTAAEAIALLATGKVAKISLDNDLGPPEAGQGRDVARWIEEHAFKGQLRRLQLRVHTQNSVARTEICRALQNASRYWMDEEITMASTVEVLVSWSGRGDYDMKRQSRVVRRNDKTYLVHDGYGGEYSLRGGQFRPHVYEIPEGLVETVVELVANGDDADYDANFHGYPSKIRTLEYEVLEKLKYLGEQGHLNWTSEL